MFFAIRTAFIITMLFFACYAAGELPDEYDNGVAHFRAGRDQEAVDCWRRVWRTSRDFLTPPMKAKLFVGMARAYERLGDTQNAYAAVNHAERFAPQSKTVAKLKKRLRPEGRRAAGGARTDPAARPRGPMTMGEALQALRDAELMSRSGGGTRPEYARLVPVFKSAIERKEDVARAHWALAVCLLHTEETTEHAEQNLRTSLELHPSDPQANYLMADVQKRKGDGVQELRYLAAARQAGLDTPELYVRLSLACDAQKVDDLVARVFPMVERAAEFDLSYVREIHEGVTDAELKAKIAARLAAIEEERKKQQEEQRLRATLVANYFSSPG